MAVSAVGRIAVNIGSKLIMKSREFQKGVSRSMSSSGDRIGRTGQKISAFQKGINAENKKQERMEVKKEKDKQRNANEALVEAKKAAGPIGNLINNVVKKPLQALWQLVLGWAVMNLPAIIKAVRIFIKKIRVFVGSVNAAIRATGGVFQGMVKVVGAFFQNMKEFDFQDKSGRIAKANEEMMLEFGKIGDSFDEMKNVWNKSEEDLDRMLAEMDVERLARDTANNNLPEPQDTASGRPRSGGGSDDLFELIASGEGGYNSINRGSAGDTPGGAKSVFGKDLTEMTVGEIMSLQQQGKVFAVGKYQIIPSTMKDFVARTDVKPSDKFDATTQEKFKGYVIDIKRPAVGKYLRGESDNRALAAQELAREFASVGLSYSENGRERGQGRYDNDSSGNLASISPDEIEAALDVGREQNLSGGGTQTGGRMPEIQSGAQGEGSYSLTNKVPYSQFSRSESQGGGSIGKTSGYNEQRGGGRIHKGIDIGTSGQKNVGVALLTNGRVTYVGAPDGLRGGAGRMIIISDASNSSREYVFMHMEKIFLRQGQAYKAGTVIGEIGNTGGSHGEHLHFEVRINNSHIDPGPFMKLLSIGRISRRTANANITGTATQRSTEIASAAASNRTNEGGQSRTKTKTIVVSQENYIQTA